MTFSYFSYLLNNLMLPVFGIAFIAFPVCKMIGRVIGQVRRGESVDFGDSQMVLMFLGLIVLAVILVNMLLGSGGLYLITERTGDALTVEGAVEQIESYSIWESPRYNVGGEVSNGYAITVDGVTCTSMALGTLEVGDAVTVTYLPKSGLVLSIEEVNP